MPEFQPNEDFQDEESYVAFNPTPPINLEDKSHKKGLDMRVVRTTLQSSPPSDELSPHSK